MRYVYLFAALLISATAGSLAVAQTPGFVAPPRTITDITTILENEKLDPARLEALTGKANAIPPATQDPKVLARFHFERGAVRVQLGRVNDAVGDLKLAIELGRDQNLGPIYLRMQQLLGQVYGWAGDLNSANGVFRSIEQQLIKEELPSILFDVTRWLGINTIQLGHLDAAEVILKRNQTYLADAEKRPGWATNPSIFYILAHVSFGNAMLLEARGQFREAAATFADAEQYYLQALDAVSSMPNPPARVGLEQVSFWMAARAGRALAREGHLAEAEVSARRAVVTWLKLGGKYNLNTARILTAFAMILVEEGRHAEAETITRNVIDIYDTLGTQKDSQVYAICLGQLAGILALQGRWTEAAQTYAALDRGIAGWDNAHKEEYALDVTRIFTAYRVNDLQAGMAGAQRLLALQTERFGRDHAETALARGVLAMGLAQAGRADEALQEFRAAAPILIAAARDTQASDDDAVAAAAREQRIQTVIEAYMTLLAAQGDTAAEGFRLADAIRGHSVQKALAASAARAATGDLQLAALVRRGQDLEKEANAQLGVLNTLFAQPGNERDPRAVKEARARADRLNAELAATQREVAQRFPDYAALIAPESPTIESVRAVLKPGEAMLSFYFGRERGFVWAVPQSGLVAFASIPLSAGDMERKVAALRMALEPNAATINEIPPFDVAAAHELYRALLAPVEAGWKPARSLIVATNGALGLLPLSVLPTAAATLNSDVKPMFAGYRDVPWLARTHAVTMVPSAAAFRTLRQLPPSSDARAPMIGFGDPIFSLEELAEAQAAQPVQTAEVTTRGLPLKRRSAPQLEGVDSAELAMLPRLPDTAEELKSIAIALQVDPAKVLNLGIEANERTVKTTDLARYKIIVFATHGLVPGELNGLTQPALALTAPDVAGIGGDGLLTMEEILALKLDADWVVLSACNTGTGAGAGAEAASGLGRAFFYAGTRALLVTNWSVHSQSARELTTDLFRRQAHDPKITRAEALRQAMMALVDGPGFTDASGKPLFAYAHPLFWAPYTIIGDGG